MMIGASWRKLAAEPARWTRLRGSARSIARSMQYLGAHWRGEHHIARAVLINGLLFYVVASAVMFGAIAGLGWPPLTLSTLVIATGLLVVGLLWSAVGIVRSAMRTIEDSQAAPGWKVFAMLSAVLLVLVIIAFASDVRRLLLNA